MVQDKIDFTGLSRRGFLVGAGGLALASALPSKFALAQGAGAPPVVRPNLSSSEGSVALEQYKTAIAAMLDLPPTDPRNWYRYALIHTLDCPHGNWWFLPWHRAYIGWLEEICRQMLQDLGDVNYASFALPYWDWTAEPHIPNAFFEGYLNPANELELWIENFEDFEDQFREPMETFFADLNEDQRSQLDIRYASFTKDGEDQTVPLNSAQNLFDTIQYTPFFFARSSARTLRRGCKCFNEPTLTDVSIGTVRDALSPNNFGDFGSPISEFHSEMSGFSVLEGQPHNHVHNEIGGFMQDNMSPVDPLFFMHHGNIERLWNFWTSKQEACSLDPLPQDPGDLAKWREESFFFYVDANGDPVEQNTAGNYETTEIFGNYTYEPGSGEESYPCSKLLTNNGKAQVFAGNIAAEILDFSNLATSNIELPEGTLRSVVGNDASGHVIAEITIIPPKVTRNLTFNILINAPEGKRNIGFKGPHFAGSFQFFGHHSHSGKPVTFSIALTKALKDLRAKNKLGSNKQFQVSIVPDTKGITVDSLESVLQSVKLKFL